jgi:two-component system OmpR family sensor kinase
VRRPLSLRTRLVLGMIVLSAVGLLAADIATYKALGSFLVDQTDTSLDDAHRAVELALGQGGRPPPPPSADRPPPRAGPLAGAVRGYYVQLRRDGRIVVSGAASQFSGGTHLPPPSLPQTISLPGRASARTGERVAYFTVDAVRGGGRYRVRAWSDANAPQNVVILAAPLDTVDSTLHRLLVIELLVTALVLAALAVLGLWVVRIGLRPLDAIGATAARIADGDLSQRIERDDPDTEVGRLGRALNAMLAQIEAGYRAREASERRLRRFVADASHELRTPLSAVRAYAELFGRGAAVRPDDLERSMKGITRESERMTLLVEDLLLLARLDEGRPLERAPVRLDELVGEAVDAARAVDPGRPLDARLDPAVVVGDRDRLRQAVDNLLANVRAHTPAGTPAHVSVTSSNGSATVAVADEGPGLAPEQVEHVFERFYRTDVSRARASGGVGLGLAIVAAVAEAHDGRASAESAVGGGTTFRVELPPADS